MIHRTPAALSGVFLAAALASATAFAQGTSGTTPATTTNGPIVQPMPHGVVPNKAELAISAFHKLDPDNKGYVTRQDVAQLAGFESAFAQADMNRDGRLNASEFNSAWAIYTGNNP
ncbi:MAG TPA: hypothetical protein VFC24_13880 [Casimicrobiaceae bacterium]|nr:hypothetical protein [Casimicrobiaceae bacterium]